MVSLAVCTLRYGPLRPVHTTLEEFENRVYSENPSNILRPLRVRGIYNNIKRELYATDCECFEIKFYTDRSLAVFWLSNVQKMTI